MTRQYQWALLRRKAGLCVTCGKKAKAQMCKACWAKRRDYNRNRYRKAHGIPLDMPITRGRIRRAFTLIELLCVLAIISIIAGLATLAFKKTSNAPNSLIPRWQISGGEQYKILVIDGCEYVYFNGTTILHKANCTNEIHQLR